MNFDNNDEIYDTPDTYRINNSAGSVSCFVKSGEFIYL